MECLRWYPVSATNSSRIRSWSGRGRSGRGASSTGAGAAAGAGFSMRTWSRSARGRSGRGASSTGGTGRRQCHALEPPTRPLGGQRGHPSGSMSSAADDVAACGSAWRTSAPEARRGRGRRAVRPRESQGRFRRAGGRACGRPARRANAHRRGSCPCSARAAVSTARMEPSPPPRRVGGGSVPPAGARAPPPRRAVRCCAQHAQQNRAGRRQDRTGRSTVVVLGALPPVLLAIKPAIEVVAQAGGADARWRRPSTCRSSTAARAPPSRPEQLVAFHRNPCSRSAPSTHPLCRALIALRTLPSS